MKCQICNKNEADVVIGLNIGDVENNLCICNSCMQNIGLDIKDNIIRKLFSVIKDSNSEHKCPNCGKTYLEFLQDGRYGCKDCYNYFNDIKKMVEENNMNNSNNVYKLSDRVLRAREQEKGNLELLEKFLVSEKFNKSIKSLIEIKKLMLDAVKNDDFEEAARLRDTMLSIDNDSLR